MTIELGPPPRPTDDAELASRISDQLRRRTDLIENPDWARVSVVSSAAGVERVHFDLTGVRFKVPATPETGASGQDSSGPTSTATQPDVVGAVTLRAQPMQVEGRQIWVDAAFSQVPIEWHEGAQVAVELVDPSPEHPLTGSVQAEIGADDLEQLLEELFNKASEGRITVSRLDLGLSQTGPGRFEANGEVTVRQGLLAGRFRALASVSWDEQYTVTVHSVRLSSRNPLWWIPLVFANRWLVQHPVAPYRLRRPELGVEVSDLQVDYGQRLRLMVAFARS